MDVKDVKDDVHDAGLDTVKDAGSKKFLGLFCLSCSKGCSQGCSPDGCSTVGCALSCPAICASTKAIGACIKSCSKGCPVSSALE